MTQTTSPSRIHRWTRRLLILLAVYLLLAYIILPRLWLHHEHQPGLADLIMATLDGLWLDWLRRGDTAAVQNGLEGCVLFARLRLGAS